MNGVFKWIVYALIAVFGIVFLGGCETFQGRTIDEQQQQMDMYAKYARENNLIAVLQADHDGKVGFFWNQEAGLDTGGKIHATFLHIPNHENSSVPVGPQPD